ncbi:MAG: hypothetical protein IKR73_03605 [Oscillospiraceae bacterium]|nr:hypothetical protein [Oscillospiraceae bacterium]
MKKRVKKARGLFSPRSNMMVCLYGPPRMMFNKLTDSTKNNGKTPANKENKEEDKK